MTNQPKTAEWKATACILCYANCGIQVQTEEGRITRVKGDKNHPASKGYTCNKALQIDYYQNAKDRPTAPLRRKPDGSFEEIDWPTAISEIAQKMRSIRDEHGGDKIFRYGGGGQGNHLGGSYFGAVSAALDMKYYSNALAQEKTGYAWMMGRMFGANVHGELHDADCLLIVGKNPWQSNGIQRSRVMLRQASKDPNRALIILDPRRTESAELADYHLQVKPGRDAWCLSAMIAHILQEGLADEDWLEEHANGVEAVTEKFGNIPVDSYASFSGVEAEELKAAAEALAKAPTSAYYEDIGIQMAPHSTLVSYLNLLLMLVTGNFGKEHTMGVLSQLTGSFFGIDDIAADDEEGYEVEYKKSPVVGARIVSGLVPCNVITEEILTDHPNRYRAMWIESGNPAHSMADSHKWREALRVLDLVVVIDVAMTETAEEADYILPAATQYEKWEATFFNFEFPKNVHHFRAPLFESKGDVLPEPEIHARLVEALEPFDFSMLDPLKEAAKEGLDTYGAAAFGFLGEHPELSRYLSYIVYRTLGPVLPEGAGSAAMYWPIVQQYAAANDKAVRRAGFEGEGLGLGNALFEGILKGRSGVVFSVQDIEETFDQLKFEDSKVQLQIGEMLDDVAGLREFEDVVEEEKDYPFILSAGERRSHNANTIIRNPAWMKSNDATSMAMHPDDASALGVGDGGRVRIVTKAGEAEVNVSHDAGMRQGTLSMSNGLGLHYPDENGERVATGVSVNELTSREYRDKYLGTPFHKYVPARIERL